MGTEEESSERPSSDEEEADKGEGGGDPWTITREQLGYYTTQFLNMQVRVLLVHQVHVHINGFKKLNFAAQPNPRGSIPGALAKEFFEKSRLPVPELRKIWQLSDVTKTGCLSLEEFLAAMHLVVLRRNDIALPEDLPVSLQPRSEK